MEITITRPDDWHLHLRDGPVLADLLPHTARCFRRAIVMPNLKPPLTTAQAIGAYRTRILDANKAPDFEPLMTLFLSDAAVPQELREAHAAGVTAAKLYPAGATTHSESGVTDVVRLQPVLETMEQLGMPLLVHGEVTDPEVDIFDRERKFVEHILAPLHTRLPGLKIVLEHVSTREGVEFVLSAGASVAATITPHHLLYNRNALFAGGLRPHHYCLPVLKSETDRRALLAAATGGNPKFFLGTDSAPHSKRSKETDHGCAGVFNAHAALEIYAMIFEEADALDRLEGFASRHGPKFYTLPLNPDRVRLVREPWSVPTDYPLGGETVVPLLAGSRLPWRFVGTV